MKRAHDRIVQGHTVFVGTVDLEPDQVEDVIEQVEGQGWSLSDVNTIVPPSEYATTRVLLIFRAAGP